MRVCIEARAAAPQRVRERERREEEERKGGREAYSAKTKMDIVRNLARKS